MKVKTYKLSKILIYLFLVTLLIVIIPQKVEAFDSLTHRFITSQGIFLIKNDKTSDELDFFYQENGAKLLMFYSIMPDIDETDGALGVSGSARGHFYDPATGLNFMGQSDNTANTRFSEHYNNAVLNYLHGSKKLAWSELGRALHYLQDLNTPHHAANLPNLESPSGIYLTHAEYEAWVERNRLSFTINTASLCDYDYVLGNTNWVVGHNAAINSKSYIKYIKSWYYELDKNNKYYAAQNTLPLAQKLTGAVLHKFYMETR